MAFLDLAVQQQQAAGSVAHADLAALEVRVYPVDDNTLRFVDHLGVERVFTPGLATTVQAANKVYAGPSTGADAAPTFRLLTAADIPSLSGVYQALGSDLTALEALNATGFARQAGAGSWSIVSETGSGNVVRATSPTIVTPTVAKIANLTNNGVVKTSGGDGTLSIAQTLPVILGGFGGAAVLTSGQTRYMGLFDATNHLNAEFASTPIALSGTLRNFYMTLGDAQPGSGSLVITLMKNGVADNITVTLAASGGTNTVATVVSDLTHTTTVTAGDIIYFRIVNNATANSAVPIGFSIQLDITP